MSMMLQSSAPFVVASALLSDMMPLSAFFFLVFCQFSFSGKCDSKRLLRRVLLSRVIIMVFFLFSLRL